MRALHECHTDEMVGFNEEIRILGEEITKLLNRKLEALPSWV